jgi:hypothetical protein
VWALPFLTVLCPSQRYYTTQEQQVKKLTDFTKQIIGWLSKITKKFARPVYLVGDGSFATLDLFMQAQSCGISMIARMKFNARLYEKPPTPTKGKPGPKPKVGQRLTAMKERLTHKDTPWKQVVFSQWYGSTQKQMLFTSGVAIWRKSNTQLVKVRWVLLKDPEEKLEPLLLACTHLQLDTKNIVCFFVRRWRVEVTFAEVRRHLGVETQRQWSDLAIQRTTPCLMALFSIVCLWANSLNKVIEPKQAAWYKKRRVTFSDVLAAVKMELLQHDELLITAENDLVNNYTNKIRQLYLLITQAAA